MCIAVEFRLKPLVTNNAGTRRSEGESKAYKQLKQDCQALVNEHPTQICYTADIDKVQQAAEMVFREFQMEDHGHEMVR